MNVVRKFSWRLVAFASLAAMTALACIVLVPWAKIALAEAHADRLRAIYSSGLLPCGAHMDGWDALIRRYQPEKVTFEIREVPALANEARVIQVAGSRLYFFEFRPLYKDGYALPPELNTEVAPKIAIVDISFEVAQVLSSLLAEDIRRAQPREQNVVDGVDYTFSVPGVGCAVTNSPPPSSRASKLTELYDALVQHAAASDANARKVSNQNILILVRALQVN